MKMNNLWIPIAVAIIALAIIALDELKISIMPFLSYLILIAIVVYLLIAARCCLIKTQTLQEPKMAAEFEAKITMLNETLERLEKKVDKIEKILENVSE